MPKYIVPLVLGIFMTSCVSLNSVSLTQIPKNRSQQVSATASKMIIFGLSFNNDFVSNVSNELADKCKNGKVTGILTKDELVNYFLHIVVRRRVVANGYCSQAKA